MLRGIILQFHCEDYVSHLEASLGTVVLITHCVARVCLALLFILSSQVILILFSSLLTLFQPGLSGDSRGMEAKLSAAIVVSC